MNLMLNWKTLRLCGTDEGLKASVMGRPVDGSIMSVSADVLWAVSQTVGTMLGLSQISQKWATKR